MARRVRMLGYGCLLVALVWTGAHLLAQGGGRAVALPAFSADAVMAHVKVLASDEFVGRAPGTKGEDLSVAYITQQYQKAGL